jgi:hypothetical protein
MSPWHHRKQGGCGSGSGPSDFSEPAGLTKAFGRPRSVFPTCLARVLVCAAVAAGCSDGAKGPDAGDASPANHPAFPIGAGATHAIGRDLGGSVIGCQSCHSAGPGLLTQDSCVGCHAHEQAITDRLHLQVPGYEFASAACTSCHASGAQRTFTHAGVTADCAPCHGADQPYAALPATGHRPITGLDCSTCHDAGNTTIWSSWAGGQYHRLGSATPPTCLPCHENEAPTSTAGWRSMTYALSPFDYGTNSLGVSHGGDLDCAICHAGPGSGAWGNHPDWAGGQFVHGTGSIDRKTCVACHVSQRPDLRPGATAPSAAAELGFDHAPAAALDCIACHQATVAAQKYADYFSPATSTLPGGDWQGGQAYPGSLPVGYPGEHIELETATLAFSTAGDLVVGATMAWEDVRDFMVHTAAAIPPELRPGPDGAPDYDKCWHCHLNKNGAVTKFQPGSFHAAFAAYAASPGAPATPLPQPTSGCRDCHAATAPKGIVTRSSLQPMKHDLAFAAPAVVAGVTATGIADLECSTCHRAPGGSFADGTFHRDVAGVMLSDCVGCHYLTMADAAAADVQKSSAYRMRHRSAQLSFQNCIVCHPSAPASAADPTVAAASWQPGYYHSVLATQPAACNDCHAVSAPMSTIAALDHSTLASGGDGRDCGDCHLFPGTGTTATPNWLGATTPLY